MVTKLDINGTLVTFTDIGTTPAAPSFGASVYLNGGVFYQKTAAGVIGTLTNGGGTGSVTSVSVLTTIPGLASAGSPIIVNGTIILSGTLTPGGGGTGIGAYTAGDTLYATGAQTLAKLGIGANDYVYQSNGTAPFWGTLPSTYTQWTATGTLTHLRTSTQNVTVGGATDIARLGVIGDTDEVQFRVRANATQTNAIALFEDSGGNTQVSVAPLGGMTINEEGNDSDTRIESADNANAFVVNAGTNNIGIGTDTPDVDVILDVVSTEKASRPFPTMDSTQRDAIASPATGSVIYNSTTTQFEWYNGAAWVAISGSGAVPYGLVKGLALTKETAAILNVGLGSIEVNGTVVNKTTKTRLTMSTNGDWIGGTSLEAASTYASVYADASGNIKFYNALPNYPRPDTASRVANMRVNQVGWNGTSGSGLNATSIVYDTDTGEGSVVAGMYLGVYSDSAFTTGRGRGSGASASVNFASFALITAIDTATNTLTLASGHNIAFNDNDYLIVIEPGALEYLNVSGTWYRFIARMYNNASSDLDDMRLTKRAGYVFNEASNYTVSGTSFASVDSTLGKMDIFTSGGDIRAEFNGSVLSSSNYVYLSFAIDGIAVSDDGTFTTFLSDLGLANGVKVTKQLGVLPGTHTADLQGKVIAGNMTIYAGAGTANLDLHPEMWVSEVQVQ